MTEEERNLAQARFAAKMLEDFQPSTIVHQHSSTDARSAAALEYIAFQLGRIRQKLEQE